MDAHSPETPHAVEFLLDHGSEMLKDLIKVIGHERAARIVAAHGGTRLYIPQMPTPTDSLSDLVGYEAACALARTFGGDRIEVPNPTARRLQIIELRASGLSIDVIARTLRCTRRRVFQVLAEARRKPRRPKAPPAAPSPRPSRPPRPQ